MLQKIDEQDAHVWVGADVVSRYNILPPEDEAVRQYLADQGALQA